VGVDWQPLQSSMAEMKPIPVHSDVFNEFSSAILLKLECRLPRSHDTSSARPRAFQGKPDSSASHLGCLTADQFCSQCGNNGNIVFFD
jgi:hypothetical protein